MNCNEILDTTFETTFDTAASNSVATIFMGCITEPMAVASQRLITNPVDIGRSSSRAPVQRNTWETQRRKDSQLLFGNL